MNFKVIQPGQEPYRKYDSDAGYDLKCRMDTAIYPESPTKIPTGVCVEIPWGYVGLIRARSSSSLKGLAIHGTIDSDYRGEIYLIANNMSGEMIRVKQGERIAQLVVVPCLIEPIEIVDELPETERGSGGFGSTGQI